MEWFNWEHFYYMFKNNKINKKDILLKIYCINNNPPIIILNIIHMLCNDKIKEEMIYSYINNNININYEYYVNVY